MHRTTKLLIAGVAVVGIGFGAAGIAVATGDDDEDVPITGPDLEAASAAALAHTGEGRVTETEVGDEESYYEVEVTLDDGREIDVQLDEDFTVVGVEDEADDDTGTDDD